MGNTPSNIRITVFFAVLVCVVGGVVYLKFFAPASKNSQEPDPDALAKIGQVAPDFEVINLDGAKMRLSDFRGKVILLAFFAT